MPDNGITMTAVELQTLAERLQSRGTSRSLVEEVTVITLSDAVQASCLREAHLLRADVDSLCVVAISNHQTY